jgi:hypothetical protein
MAKVTIFGNISVNVPFPEEVKKEMEKEHKVELDVPERIEETLKSVSVELPFEGPDAEIGIEEFMEMTNIDDVEEFLIGLVRIKVQAVACRTTNILTGETKTVGKVIGLEFALDAEMIAFWYMLFGKQYAVPSNKQHPLLQNQNWN